MYLSFFLRVSLLHGVIKIVINNHSNCIQVLWYMYLSFTVYFSDYLIVRYRLTAVGDWSQSIH